MDVSHLFDRSANRRTVKVGIEQELIAATTTGHSVTVNRLRRVLTGPEYAPFLSFEPGGQLELSLPAAHSAADSAAAFHAAVAAARRDAAAAGIVLLDDAVDDRPVVPRRLRSPRYDAMERHFDSIGPAGRVMMRRTASTQVCLDWWPGEEGIEQYRALLLSGPWIAAAYARSTGPGSRLATWLDVDPDRTAFDGRLLVGDPVEAYTRFGRGAVRFVEPHLTTLFPPVRPRGAYLEVRYLDSQPLERIGEVLEVIATIAYDAEVRARVLHELEPLAHRLGDYWRDAAAGSLPREAVAA